MKTLARLDWSGVTLVLECACCADTYGPWFAEASAKAAKAAHIASTSHIDALRIYDGPGFPAKATCTWDDCAKAARAFQLCSTHLYRLRRDERARQEAA